MKKVKGSYILLIELASSKDILIGKLGCISFPQAFYAYVGSAMNGLEARLAHHLRDSKKLHWHIDYLLEEARILQVMLFPCEPFIFCHSERSEESRSGQSPRSRNLLSSPFSVPAHQGNPRGECLLAQALAKDFQSIPGFGSSDCRCKSHLYFDADKDKLKTEIMAACEYGLNSGIYN